MLLKKWESGRRRLVVLSGENNTHWKAVLILNITRNSVECAWRLNAVAIADLIAREKLPEGLSCSWEDICNLDIDIISSPNIEDIPEKFEYRIEYLFVH